VLHQAIMRNLLGKACPYSQYNPSYSTANSQRNGAYGISACPQNGQSGLRNFITARATAIRSSVRRFWIKPVLGMMHCGARWNRCWPPTPPPERTAFDFPRLSPLSLSGVPESPIRVYPLSISLTRDDNYRFRCEIRCEGFEFVIALNAKESFR